MLSAMKSRPSAPKKPRSKSVKSSASPKTPPAQRPASPIFYETPTEGLIQAGSEESKARLGLTIID